MYRPIIGGAKCIVAPNQNFGGAMAHVVPTAAPPPWCRYHIDTYLQIQGASPAPDP